MNLRSCLTAGGGFGRVGRGERGSASARPIPVFDTRLTLVSGPFRSSVMPLRVGGQLHLFESGERRVGRTRWHQATSGSVVTFDSCLHPGWGVGSSVSWVVRAAWRRFRYA
jgi:hypothetical protein